MPRRAPRLLALGERRRPAGVVAQQVVELGAEGGVGPRVAERGLELLARGDERLGDEATAELAEPSVGVRLAHQRSRSDRRSFVLPVVWAARRRPGRAPGRRRARQPRMNAFSLRGSLRPGLASTPVDTSTPHGRTASIASATFSGVRPPASMTRMPSGAPSASAQSNTSPDPGAGESTRIASAPYVVGPFEPWVARRERLDHERHSRRDARESSRASRARAAARRADRPCARSRPPARPSRRGRRRPSSPRAADGERCRAHAPARPAAATARRRTRRRRRRARQRGARRPRW